VTSVETLYIYISLYFKLAHSVQFSNTVFTLLLVISWWWCSLVVKI
jgi:hypothetical protein